MLASIMNSRSKFIFLRVLQIDDFQENMHRTCVRISQMFTAIGDFVTDYCPHFIRVQEH